MIPAYSAQQIRDAEAPHLAAGEPLMARAAAGLADEIRRQLRGEPGRVLLLVGSGNNGGDALYAGAELAAEGTTVSIIRTSTRVHEAGLAAALAAGATVESPARAEIAASEADVVVDGVLGTGTSGGAALRGDARSIVEAVMPALDNTIVVAVDIPSGIDPDDGSVPDPVVLAADVTVTFGGYKAGLLIAPGSIVAGRVRLIDIGLTADLERLEPLLVVPDGSGG
jgi:NAD(P)H-hydrate epimerase